MGLKSFKAFLLKVISGKRGNFFAKTSFCHMYHRTVSTLATRNSNDLKAKRVIEV